jgi:hypothetical protein
MNTSAERDITGPTPHAGPTAASRGFCVGIEYVRSETETHAERSADLFRLVEHFVSIFDIGVGLVADESGERGSDRLIFFLEFAAPGASHIDLQLARWWWLEAALFAMAGGHVDRQAVYLNRQHALADLQLGPYSRDAPAGYRHRGAVRRGPVNCARARRVQTESQ